jgi:predicted secreted protein
MATNNATYTGEAGVVKFSDDTSAVVAVASVRSFTLDQETQTIESSVMGTTGRTYLAGLTQFSGTMDVYLRDDDDGQNSLFSAIGANPAAIELYPSGETTGVKLSGDVIITGHSITSNFDGMVEASITYQGSGALTKTPL